MRTELEPGETLQRDGRANLFRGAEAVGGHLYLTNRRLVFESHDFNVQTGTTQIPLEGVDHVGKVWTRVFGLLPLAPNGLLVRLDTGTEYRFVCNRRDDWMRQISAGAPKADA